MRCISRACIVYTKSLQHEVIFNVPTGVEGSLDPSSSTAAEPLSVKISRRRGKRGKKKMVENQVIEGDGIPVPSLLVASELLDRCVSNAPEDTQVMIDGHGPMMVVTEMHPSIALLPQWMHGKYFFIPVQFEKATKCRLVPA
jgi:hypothetical protein